MKTSPREAARNAPNAEALRRALDMTPDEVTAVEQGEPGRHRGRVKPFAKYRGRRALGPEDPDTVASEFRGMGEDKPAPEPAPAPRRTGPQPAARWLTGPQPSFTPAGAQTGPMAAAQPRHAGETERILAIAQHRADAAPVPVHEHQVTAAQALAHIDQLDEDHLQYPAYDATDGYGGIPSYVALMRRVSLLTGTSSRFEFPGAWPLPVAPHVPQARDVHDLPVAVTAGTPLGTPLPGCWSLNAGTGEQCVNAAAPPHGDRSHFGPSGDEWTDESGTYCGGDVDCTCWDHRQAAGSEAAS